MRRTRKGDQWHVRMDMYISVEDMPIVAHTLVTIAAALISVTQAQRLPQGEEEPGFGEAAYQGVEKTPEHKNHQIQRHIALQPGKRRAMGNSQLDRLTEQVEQSKVSMRTIADL